MRNVYIVGKCGELNYLEWALVGVFTNLLKARLAAKTKKCFIGRLKLNKDLGIKTTEWPIEDYEWPKHKINLK